MHPKKFKSPPSNLQPQRSASNPPPPPAGSVPLPLPFFSLSRFVPLVFPRGLFF